MFIESEMGPREWVRGDNNPDLPLFTKGPAFDRELTQELIDALAFGTRRCAVQLPGWGEKLATLCRMPHLESECLFLSGRGCIPNGPQPDQPLRLLMCPLVAKECEKQVLWSAVLVEEDAWWSSRVSV